MSHKLLDENALLHEGVGGVSPWDSTGAKNGTSFDLEGTDGWGMDEFVPPEIVLKLKGLVGASATLAIALHDSANDSSFALVTPVGPAGAATAIATVEAASPIRFRIPSGTRRYVRLVLTVGTAALTAGTIDAGVVK